MDPPNLPAPLSTWTLRLAAPRDVALAAVSAAGGDDIRLVKRDDPRLVFTRCGREPAPRVTVDVREREDGSELVATFTGVRRSTAGWKAWLLVAINLYVGFSIAHASLLGYYMVIAGCVSAFLLLRWQRQAAHARRADFAAIAGAIDRACVALKPGQEGQAYRVAPPGPEPAPKDRRRRAPGRSPA
ncbi:hypothetical protein ACOXH8_21265 [Nannocystis pusilla]